ncbi:MAG: acylphosphatase [Candidatus Latescibacterota bacterium]|nr:MAG: acylphosphatase [Candidatus Latescibacterota bacterium]
MARLHVWVTGRVQGVFFRDSTRRAIEGLDLTGWVRNLPDGRVEAVFQGNREVCEKGLAYVKTGPPSARVDHVDAQWEDDEEELTGFEVRY